MGTFTKALCLGLTVALIAVLGGFPGQTSDCRTWWGPTWGWGQENTLEPEDLSATSQAGNNFTGEMSLLNNTVEGTGGFYRTRLLNAFQGFIGMAQVNQAAGWLNNQATYIGLAGMGGGPAAGGLRMTYLSQAQNNFLAISNSTYQAQILGPSFADGAGISLVNQAAGHLNTQLTALFLSVGNDTATDLTDLQLGAISSHNTLVSDPDAPGLRAVDLELDKGAFQNYTGIWGTSQIAGNLNQVTTIFNVRVTTVP